MGIICIIGISLLISLTIVIVIGLLLLLIQDIIDLYEETVERLVEHKEWKKAKDKKAKNKKAKNKKEMDLDILE